MFRISVSFIFLTHAAETDHLLCDTTKKEGCTRCAVQRSQLCCDLHDGAKVLIDALHPPTAIERPLCAPRRSPLKDYVATASDMELKDLLHNWRVSQVIGKFGQGGLANFGPGIVMQTETLTRIVDCAHHGKIKNTLDLKRETKWDGADTFGDDVLALIRQVHPSLSPFTSEPLPSATSSVTAQDGLRKERTCSACGGTGHIRTSLPVILHERAKLYNRKQ